MNTYRFRSQTFHVVCEQPQRACYCTSPKAAIPILLQIFEELDQYQEHFAVVALNVKGVVIGHKVLCSGTETACLVSPAMVLRAALVLGGTTFLAVHNHPSGSSDPSREDIALTRRMRSAGEGLGLPLADHIILGSDNHHSFRCAENWDKGWDK
jgi:DNA repair protein RadC